MELVTCPDGSLALVDRGMRLQGDFARFLPRLRQRNLNRELLVRAARIRGVADPLAVDATAGLGEDALLLAAAGFRVIMFERDPTVAALLADALKRAQQDPRLMETTSRMKLVADDALVGLSNLTERPDVVYLDPMFPAKRKEAATNKKLQLLRTLERPCDDAEAQALLATALKTWAHKVVVKRPLKGPHLAGVKPSHTIAGKVVRYDVIVQQAAH